MRKGENNSMSQLSAVPEVHIVYGKAAPNEPTFTFAMGEKPGSRLHML